MEITFDEACEEIPLEEGGSITMRSLIASATHNGRRAVHFCSIRGDETPEQLDLLRQLAAAEAQSHLR